MILEELLIAVRKRLPAAADVEALPSDDGSIELRFTEGTGARRWGVRERYLPLQSAEQIAAHFAGRVERLRSRLEGTHDPDRLA